MMIFSARTYIDTVKYNAIISLGTKFTHAVHNSTTMFISNNLSCTDTGAKSRSSSTQMRISVSTSCMIINSAREPTTSSPVPIQPSVTNIPPPFNLYGKLLFAG